MGTIYILFQDEHGNVYFKEETMNKKRKMAKVIKLNDLPEDMTRKPDFQRLVRDDANPLLIFVAKEGRVDDWAAYSSFPPLYSLKPAYNTPASQMSARRTNTPEKVERVGDKLCKEDALLIFPEFADLEYRR